VEKAGTGIELTKFLSLPKKKKKKKRGRRGRGGNDTNITIKLEGLSEMQHCFHRSKMFNFI